MWRTGMNQQLYDLYVQKGYNNEVTGHFCSSHMLLLSAGWTCTDWTAAGRQLIYTPLNCPSASVVPGPGVCFTPRRGQQLLMQYADLIVIRNNEHWNGFQFILWVPVLHKSQFVFALIFIHLSFLFHLSFQTACTAAMELQNKIWKPKPDRDK